MYIYICPPCTTIAGKFEGADMGKSQQHRRVLFFSFSLFTSVYLGICSCLHAVWFSVFCLFLVFFCCEGNPNIFSYTANSTCPCFFSWSVFSNCDIFSKTTTADFNVWLNANKLQNMFFYFVKLLADFLCVRERARVLYPFSIRFYLFDEMCTHFFQFRGILVSVFISVWCGCLPVAYFS